MNDTTKLNVFKSNSDWQALDQQSAATELSMVSEGINEQATK